MEREPTAARELGLQLHSMEVSSLDKYEGAFKAATRRVAGLSRTRKILDLNTNRKQLADLR